MTDRGGTLSHDELRAELPELAADVLDGRARAELLAHVDACPSCTLELDELTLAVDSLVHLAGEDQPPLGFETRVFEQMQRRPSRRRRVRAWRRPLLAVGAAAVAAVLAFGLGWAVHAGGGPTHTEVAVSGDHPLRAPLVSAGRTVGSVSVSYGAAPAWLSMRVEGSSWSGMVLCQVTSVRGVTATVGSFSLTSGSGTWTAPLPTGTGGVRTASVVGPGGEVLATARFAHTDRKT